MLLISHIIFAFGSLVLATITARNPSSNKLKTVYGLMGGTLITGGILVLSTPGHFLSACVSGIFYLAAVLVPVFIARRKLAYI